MTDVFHTYDSLGQFTSQMFKVCDSLGKFYLTFVKVCESLAHIVSGLGKFGTSASSGL